MSLFKDWFKKDPAEPKKAEPKKDGEAEDRTLSYIPNRLERWGKVVIEDGGKGGRSKFVP